MKTMLWQAGPGFVKLGCPISNIQSLILIWRKFFSSGQGQRNSAGFTCHHSFWPHCREGRAIGESIPVTPINKHGTTTKTKANTEEVSPQNSGFEIEGTSVWAPLAPPPTGAHEKRRRSFSQLTEELPRPGHLRVSVPRTLTKSTLLVSEMLLTFLGSKFDQMVLGCMHQYQILTQSVLLICWSGSPTWTTRLIWPAWLASLTSLARSARCSGLAGEPWGGYPSFIIPGDRELAENSNTATRDAGYTDVEWVYKPSYNWGVPLIRRVSFSILFVQFREALSWKIMVNVPTRYGLKLNPSKRGFQQLSRILLIIVGQTSVPKKEIVRMIQITSYFYVSTHVENQVTGNPLFSHLRLIAVAHLCHSLRCPLGQQTQLAAFLLGAMLVLDRREMGLEERGPHRGQ